MSNEFEIQQPKIRTQSKVELLRDCYNRGQLLIQSLTLLERSDERLNEFLKDMGMCDHEVGVCMCEDYELRKDINYLIDLIKKEINRKSGDRIKTKHE